MSETTKESVDEAVPTPVDGLDAAQAAAVRSPAPALLVVAGPGSGKTRVLTHRIAWRAASDSMQARQAVAVTFTRRAARELRTRLHQLGIADMGPVGTFHSLALAQIRRWEIDRGRAERQILAARASLSSDLAECLRRDFGPRAPLTVAAALREIDWAKASGHSVAEYRERHAARRLGQAAGEAAAVLFGHYERIKSRRRMLDFDDLLAECTLLMQSDEHFAAAQRWLHRNFFVDEFQDLNRLQWNLLMAWLGGAEAVAADEADICAVGDADQAIYGWNGSDARYMNEFERHFAEAQVVRLELNYRSQPKLVAAARAIIGVIEGEGEGDGGAELESPAGGHRQRPARPHELGPTPTVAAFNDAEAEAAGIAAWLTSRHVGGTRWDAFGVLTRTNAQLGEIASALERHGIPHRSRGQRAGLLGNKAVRELMEELRSAGTEFATLIADLRTEALDASAEDQPATSPDAAARSRLVELAEVYLEECAQPESRDRLAGDGFAAWVQAMSAGDREFSSDLLGHDASADWREGAVTLATFHSAKGLGWPHVVVAGLEDGLVPLRRGDPEEQRLFYVAVSRAARTLHLTWARTRAVPRARASARTSGGERKPSPWLAAIEAGVAEPPPVQPEDAVVQLAAARAALEATPHPT